MIASKVEDMINTVVRQTAFCDFETRVHDERRNGELMPERIGEIWMDVQRESLGPASGVSYSAVAPHNATGNFTKIVQRLPVRIRIDPDQPDAANLRVGMSVTPKIRIGE